VADSSRRVSGAADAAVRNRGASEQDNARERRSFMAGTDRR
jgi:hypothetical protein